MSKMDRNRRMVFEFTHEPIYWGFSYKQWAQKKRNGEYKYDFVERDYQEWVANDYVNETRR